MNYVIANGELYHHGVKGMKWGHRKAVRLENKVSRKYAKAGQNTGRAEYYRDKSNSTKAKYESVAKLFDKQAKKSDSKGSIFAAEAARRTATAMRNKGDKAKAQSDERAAYYEKKASRNMQKASTYATKKRVDLGKSRVDSILKDNKKKGYDYAKASDEWQQEQDRKERQQKLNESLASLTNR